MNMEELKSVFPLDFPRDTPLTDSTREESIEETGKLRGKKWTEVGSIILESFEMPCWLSPEAFHYYFPAYILAAERDFNKSSLAVEYVLSMLTVPNEEELLRWKQKRWRLFNPVQWEVINAWLDTLQQRAESEEFFLAKIADVRRMIKDQKARIPSNK